MPVLVYYESGIKFFLFHFSNIYDKEKTVGRKKTKVMNIFSCTFLNTGQYKLLFGAFCLLKSFKRSLFSTA